MNLFYFLLICLSLKAHSQDFELTPLTHDLDTSSLNRNIKIKQSGPPQYAYLRPEQRDKILSKHLSGEFKKLDQSERDLLYKSVLYYDSPTLIKKYPFLKKVNLKKLRDELN